MPFKLGDHRRGLVKSHLMDKIGINGVYVRHASGAARIVARDRRARLGQTKYGAPVWPSSIVGSLAHDACIAVAAIGMSRDVAALEIDIEPAKVPLFDLLDWITTPHEQWNIRADPCGGRMFFAAKEAVYKAVYPLDHAFFDHRDVEIDLAAGKAIVCNGRALNLRICISSHIVAVAFIPTLQ
jgi:4'-phosphopantetheinyl transferase EntD